MNTIEKINLAEKFDLFHDHYHPRMIGTLNGQKVILAKLKGPFVWHSHANEDELFYVVKGWFNLEFRDKTVRVGEGEMIIVPRGVEHRPVAEEEVHVMLFEPLDTINTGDAVSELTRKEVDRI